MRDIDLSMPASLQIDIHFWPAAVAATFAVLDDVLLTIALSKQPRIGLR